MPFSLLVLSLVDSQEVGIRGLGYMLRVPHLVRLPELTTGTSRVSTQLENLVTKPLVEVPVPTELGKKR